MINGANLETMLGPRIYWKTFLVFVIKIDYGAVLTEFFSLLFQLY